MHVAQVGADQLVAREIPDELVDQCQDRARDTTGSSLAWHDHWLYHSGSQEPAPATAAS